MAPAASISIEAGKAESKRRGSMKVLALEPYYGGSHKAFLDGWCAHSRHQFTVLGLPPFKWKWRMRHAAVTFAQQLREPPYSEQQFDVLWCSDMLNLAEFLGLASEPIRRLRRVAYFHENQLTYPIREEQKRDLHFAYSNFTTCLTADHVWFNSEFHRGDFTQALSEYLGRMPDYQSSDLVSTIVQNSTVQYPGIEPFPKSPRREPGPIRIGWNARWEYDKNPEDFFAALRLLRAEDFEFQLIVLGESYRGTPPVFERAKAEFEAQTFHWGYASSVNDYRRLLSQADIVASTAIHEFFGIGIVEAISAGAIPLVPNRLAYPEVLASCDLPIKPRQLMYGQTARDLADGVQQAAEWIARPGLKTAFQAASERFAWRTLAVDMDRQLAMLVEPGRHDDLDRSQPR